MLWAAVALVWGELGTLAPNRSTWHVTYWHSCEFFRAFRGSGRSQSMAGPVRPDQEVLAISPGGSGVFQGLSWPTLVGRLRYGPGRPIIFSCNGPQPGPAWPSVFFFLPGPAWPINFSFFLGPVRRFCSDAHEPRAVYWPARHLYGPARGFEGPRCMLTPSYVLLMTIR